MERPHRGFVSVGREGAANPLASTLPPVMAYRVKFGGSTCTADERAQFVTLCVRATDKQSVNKNCQQTTVDRAVVYTLPTFFRADATCGLLLQC